MKLVSLVEEIIQEEIEKDTKKAKAVFFQVTNKNYIYHIQEQDSVSYQKKYSDSFYHSISKRICQQQHVLCEHGIILLSQPKCHVQPLFNDFAQNQKAPFTCLLLAENLLPKTQHSVSLPVLETLWERNVPQGTQSTQDFIWIHRHRGS